MVIETNKQIIKTNKEQLQFSRLSMKSFLVKYEIMFKRENKNSTQTLAPHKIVVEKNRKVIEIKQKECAES